MKRYYYEEDGKSLQYQLVSPLESECIIRAAIEHKPHIVIVSLMPNHTPEARLRAALEYATSQGQERANEPIDEARFQLIVNKGLEDVERALRAQEAGHVVLRLDMACRSELGVPDRFKLDLAVQELKALYNCEPLN